MAKYVSCERIMDQADQVTFMGFRADERKKRFMDLVSAILEACQKVDAVEVVRCKDCKHHREEFCFHEKWWNDDGFTAVRENDFCSYGERREGE